MARAADLDAAPEVDEIPGVPLPRERTALIGHREAERELLEAYGSRRFHHAWILGGPKGIGKATLAFRFARFALAHPDRFAALIAAARDLAVSADHVVARQVAAGTHPNLLHLRRPWDDKRKRFRTELPVEEVRRTVSFFGTTASGSGWRICIVDSADEMNVSSANALLKILEEPPANSLFLLLSHTPGRLLPTIRSRCRRLDLAPLSAEEIAAGLPGVLDEAPDAATLADVTRFADGSLRAALLLLSGEGLAVNRGFLALADRLPRIDVAALHAFADLVAARGQTDNWEAFLHVARDWLHRRLVADAGQSASRLVRWTEVWEKMGRAAADAEALNLDRKQVVLDVFRNLSEVMRMPA
ncbi:DNA polymerase III subunit delta' [Polymorphum gilvum]|uniref:DNA polymerase III subunit delta n=1 Tax=Polymorphum gilvum (strain LMG 25793 / CGMCC 1.9160 / SL003B-26A1) TaxID=991905 RepID=F2IZY0_POLGS|nr:DNA polymerase III subunit delta' [Polymorphum gilvum]ADZ70706.1 DNA polymerase III subunit delta' [Polymorphum gilvum SL003B-26A1]